MNLDVGTTNAFSVIMENTFYIKWWRREFALLKF